MRGSLLRYLGSVERRYGAEKDQKPTKTKIEEHNSKDARDSPRPLNKQGQKPHADTACEHLANNLEIWRIKAAGWQTRFGARGAARFFPCLDSNSGSLRFARDGKF